MSKTYCQLRTKNYSFKGKSTKRSGRRGKSGWTKDVRRCGRSSDNLASNKMAWIIAYLD